MNYGLAKQLKNAGFPIQDGPTGPQWIAGENDDISSPTLQELLDACGVPIVLQCKGVWWIARRSDRYQSKAKAPDVALAYLWLALNTREADRKDRHRKSRPNGGRLAC
jgi:hypothetical protein